MSGRRHIRGSFVTGKKGGGGVRLGRPGNPGRRPFLMDREREFLYWGECVGWERVTHTPVRHWYGRPGAQTSGILWGSNGAGFSGCRRKETPQPAKAGGPTSPHDVETITTPIPGVPAVMVPARQTWYPYLANVVPGSEFSIYSRKIIGIERIFVCFLDCPGWRARNIFGGKVHKFVA